MIWLLCLSALTKKDYLIMAERIAKEEKVPVGLFKAIVSRESRWNPFAVYGRKKSYQFTSKKDAIAKVEALQNEGRKNINVGMVQVNLQHHKKPSIEQLFDPEFNLRYGAKYLKTLHNKFGSWRSAVGYFHAGGNSRHYAPYIRKLCCPIPD